MAVPYATMNNTEILVISSLDRVRNLGKTLKYRIENELGHFNENLCIA